MPVGAGVKIVTLECLSDHGKNSKIINYQKPSERQVHGEENRGGQTDRM